MFGVFFFVLLCLCVLETTLVLKVILIWGYLYDYDLQFFLWNTWVLLFQHVAERRTFITSNHTYYSLQTSFFCVAIVVLKGHIISMMAFPVMHTIMVYLQFSLYLLTLGWEYMYSLGPNLESWFPNVTSSLSSHPFWSWRSGVVLLAWSIYFCNKWHLVFNSWASLGIVKRLLWVCLVFLLDLSGNSCYLSAVKLLSCNAKCL